MQQEQCLESQVKKVIQNDFVDSVYSANGDVRIGDCIIKTAANAKRNSKCEAEANKLPPNSDEEMRSNSAVPSDEEALPPDFFKCFKCSYVGENRDDLKEHMMFKHVREKSHKCDVCEFSSFTSHSLKRHKQTHSTEKPFVCEICQKRFHFIDYLKRHMITHKDKERQFKCTECSYCSAYNCNLQYHVAREHSASKLFMCDVCDYKFVTGGELKKHLLSHSPLNFDDCEVPEELPKKTKRSRKESGDDVKPYKCYDCSFHCTNLDLLIHHIETKCISRVVIEEKRLPKVRERRVPGKTAKCVECDYATSNNSHLQRHVQAKHSTECNLCDFKATCVDDLRLHKLIHNEKKLHHCTQCDYQSTKASLLKQHVIRRHSQS